MIYLKQRRFIMSNAGVFGELLDEENKHLFFTLERPWLFNENNISCIPPGWYQTEWYDSPKHGRIFQLKNVLDRSYIQYHVANWAYELNGCIALGDGIKKIYSDVKKTELIGLTNSSKSIKAFNNKYLNKDIIVIITNEYETETIFVR